MPVWSIWNYVSKNYLTFFDESLAFALVFWEELHAIPDKSVCLE